MTFTTEHLAILDHTLNRAAGGRYCGGSPEMDELVQSGLMKSSGKVAWCPDEYFRITELGRMALREHKPDNRGDRPDL